MSADMVMPSSPSKIKETYNNNLAEPSWFLINHVHVAASSERGWSKGTHKLKSTEMLGRKTSYHGTYSYTISTYSDKNHKQDCKHRMFLAWTNSSPAFFLWTQILYAGISGAIWTLDDICLHNKHWLRWCMAADTSITQMVVEGESRRVMACLGRIVLDTSLLRGVVEPTNMAILREL